MVNVTLRVDAWTERGHGPCRRKPDRRAPRTRNEQKLNRPLTAARQPSRLRPDNSHSCRGELPMRIQRSWGLCVLTIIAVVIGLHEAQAQSYPSPGSAPIAAGYPGPAPQMPAAGYGVAPQYAAVPPMGYGTPPAGPPMGYGHMPPAGPMMGGQGHAGPGRSHEPLRACSPPLTTIRCKGAPQPLGPEAGMPMGDMPMGDYGMMGSGPCQFCGGYGCEVCGCERLRHAAAAVVAALRSRRLRRSALVRRVRRLGNAQTRSGRATTWSSPPTASTASTC